MDEVGAKKAALRKRLREERDSLSPAAVRAASEAVCRHVAALPAFRRARRISLYAPLPGEIDPTALAARVDEAYYPRIEQRSPPLLAFHRVADPGLLARDAMGIPTPPADAPRAELAALDLALVPGLAFDRGGHRLGFGRGYYDAALAAAGRVLRVGVLHSFQLVDTLPRSEADEPVDVIVTPEGARATGARPDIGIVEVSS